MEFDTYVQRERVQAAQVLKPQTIVTSRGPLPVERYSYIVNHTVTDEFGTESTETEVLTKNQFNDKYTRLNWREQDRQDAYNSGYEEGWKQCETANDLAHTVVSSSHDDQPADDGDSDSPGTPAGGPASNGEGKDGSGNARSGEPGRLSGEDAR